MISKKKLHYGGVKPQIMNWMIKKDAKLSCSGSETWNIKCFRKEYITKFFTFHQNWHTFKYKNILKEIPIKPNSQKS